MLEARCTRTCATPERRTAPPHAAMFFNLYFLMTGVHAFHMIIGMGVLTWAGVKA